MNVFRMLYERFLSRKVTVTLIAVLVFFYFLGLVIPQHSILQPGEFEAWEAAWPRLVPVLTALKLTTIYSSPIVLVCTGLFFINLLLVTLRRFPQVLRSLRIPERIDDFSPSIVRSAPFADEIPLQDGIKPVIETLRTLGYRVSTGERSFKAVKNHFTTLGSLFFHVSFLFLLLGGIFIFHTRFWGETFITEGQFFGGTRPEYRSVSRLSELREDFPDITFAVEKINAEFSRMEPASLETMLSASSKGASRRGTVDVNAPFKMGSTSILITDVGIAPLILVMDAGDGRVILDSFVMLNIIRGDRDHVELPDPGYRIFFRFWPDAAVDERGEFYTRSYYLKNPVFSVDIEHGAETVASGILTRPDEAIEFDGMLLRIAEIRYFGKFLITDERGGALLIIGFVLSIAGLIIKFLWTRKEVYGAVLEEPGARVLVLGFLPEYRRGLGRQEFERLTARLKQQ